MGFIFFIKNDTKLKNVCYNADNDSRNPFFGIPYMLLYDQEKVGGKIMSQGKLDFLVREILRKFPECTYSINKSQKSDSIYLYITDGILTRSIRISDHRNGYNHFFNTEIVSDKLNINCIRGAIANVCKSMRKSRTNYYLNKISAQYATA